MSKLTKWTVLVLALVVPVAVFIFLKIFGRNEFEVPPLYTDSLPERPSFCQPVSVPYAVPESIRARLCFNSRASLNLLWLDKPDEVALQRLQNAFKDHELNNVYFSPPEGSTACKPDVADSISYYVECFLFVPEQKNKILVDKAARIRGYYGTSREEIDKLIMEASIMLKKY